MLATLSEAVRLNPFLRPDVRLLIKPVGQGAAVLAWALTTPSLPGGRGLRYFTNELAPVPIPRRWLDADLAEQIWRASEAHLATGPLRL
ncbi:hypothetical protein ACN28S_27145 [Cystobacter fuscus]